MELLPNNANKQTDTIDGGERDALYWLAKVLTKFALAEQALGKLSLTLDLPIAHGSLTSLAEVRRRLRLANDRKSKALDNRIGRWVSHRPLRHLLAHATIFCLSDVSGKAIIVTRHLPRDRDDVTPDKMWTLEECNEILRQASSDGRSICDHVSGILGDPSRLAKLKQL